MSLSIFPSTIEHDKNHVLLRHENVILLVWYGEQDPEVCARVYELAVSIAQSSGVGKVAAVAIVTPSASRPSAEARAAFARLHDDPQQVIHRVASVVADEGFIAATIRSIVLSIRQHAVRNHEHAVFHYVERALEWVTDGLPTVTGLPIAVQAILYALERDVDQLRQDVA